MTEQEKRLHRCCFTGHRPEKLKSSEEEIKKALKKEIENAIADGFTTFISGTARGIDIWAAEIVIELRDTGVPIKLICAIPFKGTEELWSKEWQDCFNYVINKADLVKCFFQKYVNDCYQIRNQWMIDHSARVIAVYNGEPGGTRNAINYAKRMLVPLNIIKVGQNFI